VTLKPHNTYADLAAYFEVHQETVERWVRAGDFGAVFKKPGGTVRISRAAVERFEAAHTHDPAPRRAVAVAHLTARSDAPNPHARRAGERGRGPAAAALERARRAA
jgi:excisionase family DNA binding protein